MTQVGQLPPQLSHLAMGEAQSSGGGGDGDVDGGGLGEADGGGDGGVDGGDGSRAMRVNDAPDTTLTSASVYGRFASGALTASHSAFGLGVLW